MSCVEFETVTGEATGVRYCSGVKYRYDISIPLYENVEEFALIVTLDVLNTAAVQVMAKLYEEGAAPPCILLGVGSGTLPATLDGGCVSVCVNIPTMYLLLLSRIF